MKKILSIDQGELKEIDRTIMRIIDELPMIEWHVSNCMNEDVLREMDYFSTMPQYLTVVSPYVGEDDKLFLKPAACLPIYPQLKQYRIKNEIITTLTNVYRYDEFDNKDHFWEFTVREFVIVGTKEYVVDVLEYVLEKFKKYLMDKILKVESRIATDHFYSNSSNKILNRYQKANRFKKEIVVTCMEDEIVLGSFNYHGNHFSKKFGFDNNAEIVSGCIGFGLERWYRLWKMIK